MADVNSLLNERLTKKGKSAKVAELADRSASGNLSGAQVLFGKAELTAAEQDMLTTILFDYATETVYPQQDIDALRTITSEVKAINNQAALLHGERIKRAQTILTQYKEGAFSAWLVATYGNRQTPYNLLQYYEFYQAMPKKLRPQVEAMPKQAVYTLASREGAFDEKKQIVKAFDGETKHELLSLIRQRFPLSSTDQRRGNVVESIIASLERVSATLRNNKLAMNKSQKKALKGLLQTIEQSIQESPKG